VVYRLISIITMHTTDYDSMCEFISDYEYSKLFKRRMNKLAEEEEEQQPELEKVEEQPLVASK
jgi:hypothetical protein